MDLALQKTIGFLSSIGIGFVLRGKMASKDPLKGIKHLILSVAPLAIIFVAFSKIPIELSWLYLLFLAMGFNALIWAASTYLQKHC